MSVLLLVTNQGSDNTDPTLPTFGETLTVWGTLDEAAVNAVFAVIADDNEAFRVAKYRQFNPRDFDSEFVNAAAEDRAPDLVFLSSEQLVTHRAKLWGQIPYNEFEYTNSYVDGADVFVFPDGLYAQPFVVDPLVMYWNRDTFGENNIALPPQTWAEVRSSIVPALTERDTRRNILASAIAFGEYANVRNAQAIISMLLLQAGSQMVSVRDDEYVIGLNTPRSGGVGSPMETVVTFYTDFARPENTLYSWNRVQPEDRNAFSAGDLAIYFGFASEYADVLRRNPNINFAVAEVPQGADATSKRTYGKFYGVAIPKKARNGVGAVAAINTVFKNGTYAATLAATLNMAPTHRQVLQAGAESAQQQTAYNAALSSRGWLSPGAERVDELFGQLINDVTSGRDRPSSAVSNTLTRLRLVY